MPLDPSISLQGRPISISGTDPMQTLLTVAQLKNMQSQDQLRQLQAQEIQQGLGEYQRLQAPLADWRAMNQGQGAPGMVAGPQLATQPPAALGPPPAQQTPMNGASGVHWPVYDTMSPGTQALYPNGPPPDAGQVPTGPPPGQGGLPLTMDIAKPSADTPPQQSPNGIPSMENIAKRVQLLQQINAAGPRYGGPMATSMMALDKHELDMKKQLLENQIKNIKETTELFAGVTDQTGYEEAKRLGAIVGSTEVAQLPERFDDPRAKQWLAYRRNIGQTQQQRIEAEQKRIDQALTFFEHETERMKVGEIAIHEGATENIPYFKYGEAGRVIGQGPGAPPGTIGGLPASAPSKQAMQPFQTVEGEQAKKLIDIGETARTVHQYLDEVERLIKEGVYEQSPMLDVALLAYKKGGSKGVLHGWDEKTLDRTIALREVGARLKLAQGKLGAGTTEREGDTYGQAMGAFETGSTFGKMRESITVGRNLADKAISNTNAAKEGMREGRGIPPIPGRGTGGTSAPATSNTVTPEQVRAISDRYGPSVAEVRRRLKAAGKDVP